LVYPYVISAYSNGIYGLVIMLIFFLALTLGFAFELGKNALKFNSRQQMFTFGNKQSNITTYISRVFFYLVVMGKKKRGGGAQWSAFNEVIN